MTTLLVRTPVGSCTGSFFHTSIGGKMEDRQHDNDDDDASLASSCSMPIIETKSSSTTALGFCSVAVAMVILTSNFGAIGGGGGGGVGNDYEDSRLAAEIAQSSTTAPSLTTLSVLVLSVLVLYAIDFGKNASWQFLARKVDDAVLRAVSSSQALITSASVSASSLRFVEHLVGHHGKRAADGAVRTLQIAPRDSTFFLTPCVVVADLSLADLGDLARFATDMNRLDFNKREFLATVNSDRVRAASAEMCLVTALSRGSKVAISTPILMNNNTTKDTVTVENTDALAFVAFCRIFAEWRSERLVPPGYGRYAAGMALAKRDLIQNLQKIETAVHLYLNDMETRNGAAVDFANGRQLSSPTLGGLLRWEKAQGVHPRLPHLTDRSGASGLLWTQRQLQYQIAVFNNLLLVPFEFSTSKDAVNAAYKSTYDLYHGFIIKQMFQGSFDAAPDVTVILNHMNTGCRARTASSNNEMDDITTSTSQSSESSSSHGFSVSSQGEPQGIPTNIVAAANETKTPLMVMAGRVTEEWVKIERFFKQCSGQQPNSRSRNLLMAPEEADVVVAVTVEPPGRDVFAVTRPPTSKQTSEEEIPAFVAVAQPMLTELEALIIKLNMNDPSKC